MGPAADFIKLTVTFDQSRGVTMNPKALRNFPLLTRILIKEVQGLTITFYFGGQPAHLSKCPGHQMDFLVARVQFGPHCLIISF